MTHKFDWNQTGGRTSRWTDTTDYITFLHLRIFLHFESFIHFKTLSKCTPVFIDCPSSVTITSPAGSSFSVGYVLTCESDGYPEPSYSWTDSDGVVVSTASTVTIQNPGPFTFTCTAEGNLTTTCSVSSSVSGNATGKIP